MHSPYLTHNNYYTSKSNSNFTNQLFGVKVTANTMIMMATITNNTVMQMHFFLRALDYRETDKRTTREIHKRKLHKANCSRKQYNMLLSLYCSPFNDIYDSSS